MLICVGECSTITESIYRAVREMHFVKSCREILSNLNLFKNPKIFFPSSSQKKKKENREVVKLSSCWQILSLISIRTNSETTLSFAFDDRKEREKKKEKEG